MIPPGKQVVRPSPDPPWESFPQLLGVWPKAAPLSALWSPGPGTRPTLRTALEGTQG